jgi:hypothetical protein
MGEVKPYVEREVKLKIRVGAKKGWFEVIIGDKKFVMKQVDRFITESSTTVEEVLE